jgi:hypothetical protein
MKHWIKGCKIYMQIDYTDFTPQDYRQCFELKIIMLISNRTSRNIFYLLTYLLTPWSRVLLEKLTGLQLVKKFPEFYGARKFVTAFTSARKLFLS